MNQVFTHVLVQTALRPEAFVHPSVDPPGGCPVEGRGVVRTARAKAGDTMPEGGAKLQLPEVVAHTA